MHPPRPLSLILVILFALPVHPFSCKFTDSSVDYDITPLAGLHQANKQTSTPPTTSEAVVLMDLCGDSGVSREDGIPDEDQVRFERPRSGSQADIHQCPSNTRVCVKLLNHKSSSSDPDRVTAVIPLWPMDLAEGNIWITPMGKDGGEGFKIWVEGKEYSG